MNTENTLDNNVDAHEIRKFEEIAYRWWDRNSEFKPLHDINPLRLNYIDERAAISTKQVVDVGCGGGILAESMARRKAVVTGIDLGKTPLSVATLHALETKINVDYRHISAEALATERPESFDIVTCMEMLEHVPDPSSIIRACATLVKPGGDIFFSTLNRTPKAFALAIVGAEYVLNMLPRGTHEYGKFIRPSELESWACSVNLELQHMMGISYNPIFQRYRLNQDITINYIMHFKKESN